MALTYTDDNGHSVPIHSTITQQMIIDAVARQMTTLDNPGFCIACGHEADGCEPDARGHECEHCGEPAVYGAAELLVTL